ncbi:MAG: Sec-independent protein translocase subunit TatB [Betaproteobacteria bacterium]|nr:Sec-independent protein translocase subunit TatB [Betaproteobacteria bacterium]
MFDVGFTEMMVVGLVALIVIGPERLPKVARTMGHLFGRLQRYVNDVKADINREIELDELKKFKSQFEEAAQSVESGVRAELNKTESEMNSIATDLEKIGPEAAPAGAVSEGFVPDGVAHGSAGAQAVSGADAAAQPGPDSGAAAAIPEPAGPASSPAAPVRDPQKSHG